MGFIGITWKITVHPYLNILYAQTTSTYPEMENPMIKSAADIIEEALKHKGKPYELNRVTPRKQEFIVHFSLIFETRADLRSFLSNLNN